MYTATASGVEIGNMALGLAYTEANALAGTYDVPLDTGSVPVQTTDASGFTTVRSIADWFVGYRALIPFTSAFYARYKGDHPIAYLETHEEWHGDHYMKELGDYLAGGHSTPWLVQNGQLDLNGPEFFSDRLEPPVTLPH